MELRHLRYFVAVAEEGHITRAAERLGIQQPPLSQQIRALEAELDVQLLRRKPRGVELTQAGERLLAEARVILNQVGGAVAAVRQTGRGELGHIGLGFTSSASFHPFVPRTIRRYRDAYPMVALDLEEAGTTELAAALRAQRIDAAFVRSPIDAAAELAVRPILEEAMVVALPRSHPLGRPVAPLPLAGLAAETFILYRRPVGPGLHDAIIAACDRAGFSPRIGQEAPRMLSTLSLVAAGLGVALVPRSMSRLQSDGVVYRPLDPAAGLVAPLNLAFRRGETSAAARCFIQSARQAAAADWTSDDSPLPAGLTGAAEDPT